MDEQQKHELALKQFGQILIKRVRDVAILRFQTFLEGKMKDEQSQEEYTPFANLDMQQKIAFNKLTTKAIDETLYLLLDSIDSEFGFDILIDVNAEENVNLRDAGQEACFDLKLELLHWIEQFSRYKTD